MNLRFDEPGWSWVLLLLVVPLASWWTIERITPARRVAAILLRSLAVACVAAALARPWLLTTQASIAVVGVIDVSGSTTRFSSTPPEELASAFLRAAQPRRPDDRVGLVAFDGTARAVVMPTTGRVEPDPPRLVDDSGSALADAVTLARALVPADEAGRIVVFSDGLETIGRAERIAEIDADRVSIDTVLVPLEPLDDVAIESFDLPASALPHSRVGAIVSLRSSGDASGTLRIRMDGRSLSLQGDGASGEGLPVRLKTGSTRVRVSIPIGDGPVHELEASFEPDDPAADRLVENSAAKRAIAVPAGRSVLVLDRSGAASDLDASLRAAGFEVRRRPADSLPEDPLWLAGFDLIVLDGVPAAQMSRSAQRLVADQVQHLGAGVIALGGEASFGAGGWRGSTLAELLPVEVEPPTEDRRPRAALVFVIDRSGSMRQAVAGTRSTQQEIANEAASLATESIASRAHVGVIAFDSSPSVIVPTRPMDDSSLVVKRIRGIHSDGGTAIGAALALALDELEPIPEVDRKLVVLLTDGRGRDDALLLEQADRAANAGVTVTTISIGDSADDSLLGAVAERTGGVFHPVRNPRVLPRVLVESVQSINRPLIREGTIDVLPQGDSAPARALDRAPPLAGLCILGRPRSAETVIDAVSDENEPLLARWPAGIGRAAIFASSPDEPWSGGWSEWSGRSEFWESLARWAARAPGSAPVAAEARIEEGRFIVTIDAAAADAIEGAAVEALVRRPDGGRDSFELRRVAPRRFVGAVEADAPGAWLAVLSPRGPAGPLPPMLAAAVAPEGVEYSRQREDPAPLESLRRAGGGRELPLDRLESFDLHSRDGLRLGVRERALAPWLLVAAALCFVADAAVRRLAVRRSQVAEALRVTSASAEPASELAARRRTAPTRGAGAGATAASAAGASATSSSRGGGVGAGASTVGGARDAARPRDAVDPARERDAVDDAPAPGPTQEEVLDALRALRETPSVPSPAPPSAPAPEPHGDEDEGSSAALEALRRAKDRSRIFPP